MDTAVLGFLKADNHRLRVLEKLKSGSGTTAKQVSHKLRIPQMRVEAALKELMDRELVREEKGAYALTDAGVKTFAQVSRTGM